MNNDYKTTRAKALGQVDEFPLAEYCEKGNGECCKVKIEILDSDLEVIENAVRANLIPLPVIIGAYKASLDPEAKSCAFLYEAKDGQRLCSIYEYRPLICITNTAGGSPQDHVYMKLALAGIKLPDIKVRDLEKCGLCTGCFRKAERDNPSLPLEHLVTSLNVGQLHVVEMIKKGLINPGMTQTQVLEAFKNLITIRDVPRIILERLELLDEEGNWKG
jgi:hypothetical protein